MWTNCSWNSLELVGITDANGNGNEWDSTGIGIMADLLMEMGKGIRVMQF